jgi:hypothetical protein
MAEALNDHGSLGATRILSAGRYPFRRPFLDNVFKSRLPRPLRIGSLEDAEKTEELLLALALSPFVKEMIASQGDPDSELSKSISSLVTVIDELSKSHHNKFNNISDKVHDNFTGVFPNLSVRLVVSMARPQIKLDKLLEEGSGIRVKDGNTEVSLAQQGAGARRALFWSMLQVHNQLSREIDIKSGLEKQKGKSRMMQIGRQYKGRSTH